MASRSLRISALALAIAAPFVFASTAAASELVDRNTKGETLRVSSKGVAVVGYKARGKQANVLYWNKGSFVANRANKRTLAFNYDRSGGWKSKKANLKKFKNVCGRYSGPALPFFVTGCTAPDGSHWVLQKWARLAPNYGGNPETFTKELRVSRFKIAPAAFTLYPNWSWGGRYFHIGATLSYNGAPWYAIGFKSNGAVTDGIGRNVTIDSLDSDMGAGWRRVNAILTHRPSGQLCFGFTPKSDPFGHTDKSGLSSKNLYRLSVPGPGVSPDVQVEFSGLSPDQYTKEADEQVNIVLRALIAGATTEHSCKNIN